jgi:hypothetical protein
MLSEVNKTILFERLQCWCYRWVGLIKYTVEMAQDGMIWIPSFVTIGSGIQEIMGLLPGWYRWWEVFVKHIFEVVSGGMLYIPSFIRIGSGVQKLVWWDTYIDTETQTKSKVISWAYFNFFRKEIRLKTEHFCLIHRIARLLSVYK